MGRPPDTINTVARQLRVSPKLDADLKWFARRLCSQTAGATFSLTEAVRILLARGIAAERAAAKQESDR